MPSNQKQTIEQVKLSYSTLGKAFGKQTKKIKNQGEKQIDAFADLKLIEIKPKEIKPRNTKPGEYSDYFLYELARIRNSFEPVNLYDLIYNFTACFRYFLSSFYFFTK